MFIHFFVGYQQQQLKIWFRICLNLSRDSYQKVNRHNLRLTRAKVKLFILL